MLICVEMPETVAHQLHLAGEDGPRHALEIIALEGYRRGQLSRGRVSELLEMEFNETEQFLKENGCLDTLTVEEYEEQMATVRAFLKR